MIQKKSKESLERRTKEPNALQQWFSTGGILSPRGTAGNAWGHFWLLQLGVRCYWHLVHGGQGSCGWQPLLVLFLLILLQYQWYLYSFLSYLQIHLSESCSDTEVTLLGRSKLGTQSHAHHIKKYFQHLLLNKQAKAGSSSRLLTFKQLSSNGNRIKIYRTVKEVVAI